jgi:hypothetical protein
LKNTEYSSDLEKKFNTKINTISKLLSICLEYKKLNLNELEVLLLDKHIKQLAIELFNDGKLLLFKGSWAHGGTDIISARIKGKEIDILIFRYGDMISDDKGISRFIETFNYQMKKML